MVYKWQSYIDECDHIKEEQHWPGHKNGNGRRGLRGRKHLWCEECERVHKFARYIDSPGQARRVTGERLH